MSAIASCPSIAYATDFLTRPLLEILPSPKVSALQRSLQSTLGNLFVQNSLRLVVALSAGNVAPRALHPSCMSFGIRWADWMVLLGGTPFDLVVEASRVWTRTASGNVNVIWSTPSEQQGSAPPATTMVRAPPRTVAQQILESPYEDQEADELFASISHAVMANPVSTRQSHSPPPTPFSPIYSTCPLYTASPKSMTPLTNPKLMTDDFTSPVSRPSSRSSQSSAFSTFSNDSLTSFTSTPHSSPASTPSYDTRHFQPSFESSPSFTFTHRQPEYRPSPSHYPSHTSPPAPKNAYGGAHSVPSRAAAPRPPRFSSVPSTPSVPSFPARTLATHTHAHTVQSAPPTVTSFPPVPLVDNGKKDKTKYLYRGGVSTVLTGGVMLGAGASAGNMNVNMTMNANANAAAAAGISTRRGPRHMTANGPQYHINQAWGRY